MPILTIDGNIGCGKSTLLEYLHINYLLPIDLEPVNKWQPYLNDMYYHNKGACEFQVRVWLDRCWIQPKQDSIICFIKKVFDIYKKSNIYKSLKKRIIDFNEKKALNEIIMSYTVIIHKTNPLKL